MKIKKVVIPILIVFCTLLNNIGIVNAVEQSFILRMYETGYKSDKGAEILKLRIKGNDIPDYETHWGQVAFCVQHGEELNKGENIFDVGNPTGIYRNAARIAYLSTYRYNNGESGGNKRYAYTQNLIWQVLGQTSNSYVIDDDYPAWKSGIMDEYNKWDTMPSFDATTVNLQLGETKRLNDSNGVFKYYDSFNFTKDGITFSHEKSSNNLVITASENCTKEVVNLTADNCKKNGASKYSKTTGTANFVLKSDTKQNMICTPGFSDPKYFAMQVKLDLYGSLEIAKKDDKGNYVPDVKFKVSSNADMSNPIGTYTTGSNGKVTIDKLRPGTIYVQETKVPDHLILDNTIHQVEIKSKEVATFTATNNWKQGYIQVIKKDKKSGQTVEQAGVEFEILKGSNVLETITTNQKGIAKSSLIDYGTYIIREKKEPSNYTIATLTKEQSITENGKIYEVVMFNEPVLGQIDLSKVDSETGKVSQGDATLKGAIYTLKANKDILNPANKEVIYQKDEVVSKKNIGNAVYGDVGQKTVDSNFNITWNNLPLGEYRIEEVKAPNGFLLGNSFDFEVSSDNPDLEFDKDMDPIITVEFTNEKPDAEIILNKTFEDIKDNEGAVFRLTAVYDVIDSTDGKIIYKKGDSVSVNGASDGLYTVKNGKINVAGLPLNPTGKTVYQLEEVETLDGYVMSEDPIVYEFDIKDDKTKSYTISHNTHNRLSEAYFSKTDLNGKEIKGGTYKVVDKETMEVIDTWTSDGQSHLIKGLVFGNEYIFYEDLAPLGYTLAKPIEFTFTENKQEITMTDTIVNVRKVNENNDDMAGAVLQVVSLKTKEIVDEWTTDGTSHAVNGLMVGQDYELREIKAPQNYITANPIQFTVSEKEDMTIVMNNKYVEIAKIDQNDKPVENATLQIVDMENGKVIESWTTDEKGVHYATQLLAGKKYKLEEIDAPENYMLADPIEFEVSDDKNQTIIMTDVKTDIVEITKYDATNNQELEGARLQLKDDDGNLIEEWISTKEAHAVRLTVSSQYTLIEITAPNGYEIAESITFTVDDNGEVVQKIAMKDERIPQPPIIVETGDSTDVILYIGLMLSVSSIGFFVAYQKKKSLKEHEGE